MGTRLTQKQETFCLKYVDLENNGTQAALAAGYKCNASSARRIASENLTKLDISNRIAELRKRVEDATISTPIERRKLLTQIQRATVADFVDEYGNLAITDKKQLDTPAVQEIKTERTLLGIKTTLKLRDPVGAIDTHNKMDKIYSDKEGSVNISVPVKVEATVVNIDAREVARAIIEAYRLGLTPEILSGNGQGEDASLLSSPADIQATPIP